MVTGIQAEKGETVVLEKMICYTTSLDLGKEERKSFVLAELERAQEDGMQKLEKWQKEYMAKFWEAADVEIKGNEALQQGLHFNLFHIIQSAGRDGKTGMGAKGLSGEGYDMLPSR